LRNSFDEELANRNNLENFQHILAACKDQDRSAQQQLYTYTYSKLCTAVAVYAKDSSERDWIFNLGMLKIYTSLKNFSEGTNFLAWARTILVRSAIDHLRSNKKHLTNLSPLDIGEQEISSSDFENMMNNLETDSIILLLQQLPENERMIFNMYEIEGYSHVDIQKLTGIKKNTSKWLLAKSKKTLRSIFKNSDMLKSYGYGE